METIIIVASGPSVNRSDIDLIQKHRIKIMAVNTSWLLFKYCDFIYASDYAWWREHINQINSKASLWTCCQRASRDFCLNLHVASGPFNSGLRALQLAIEMGFKKIILYGFDCSLRFGSHWHGLHLKTKNPTPTLTESWKSQFNNFKFDSSYVEVVNCSVYSELELYRKGVLHREIHHIALRDDYA